MVSVVPSGEHLFPKVIRDLVTSTVRSPPLRHSFGSVLPLVLARVRLDVFASGCPEGTERGCAEVPERMGVFRTDGGRDLAAGGRGEAEEVQGGDAAARKNGEHVAGCASWVVLMVPTGGVV